MSEIKHPTKSQFNEDTGSSEPVMVNRHAVAERWEWDPDWTAEDQAELEQQQAEHIVESARE